MSFSAVQAALASIYLALAAITAYTADAAWDAYQAADAKAAEIVADQAKLDAQLQAYTEQLKAS